jgi:hypothetical protein
MGSKPSNSFQSNPPDSGGIRRERKTDDQGLQEREKQELATSESEQKKKVPVEPSTEGARDRMTSEGGPA